MLNLSTHGSYRASGGDGIPMGASGQRKPMVLDTVGGQLPGTVNEDAL
jgi:hypothetical protein